MKGTHVSLDTEDEFESKNTSVTRRGLTEEGSCFKWIDKGRWKGRRTRSRWHGLAYSVIQIHLILSYHHEKTTFWREKKTRALYFSLLHCVEEILLWKYIQLQTMRSHCSQKAIVTILTGRWLRGTSTCPRKSSRVCWEESRELMFPSISECQHS